MFGRKNATVAVEERQTASLEETARLELQKATANLAMARAELAAFALKNTAVIDGRSVYVSPTLTY